ncbi:MAG: GAF and ANTAR domain-containing protein [Acidimicrobiales bacterium]
MAKDSRRDRILASLVGDEPGNLRTSRLCECCAEVTGLSGAGVMLMFGDLPTGSVCASNDVSARIEQLQYDLGEGPCVDACRQDRPVFESDLAEPEVPRWLAFSRPAVDAGAAAIFGFPLQVGSVRLGAINFYRDSPGALTDEQHADALVLADLVAQIILVLQAQAPQGALSPDLEVGSDFQYGVHQAAGMVAAQLGVSIGIALVRLRAHAFGNNSTLSEVAWDVVARRLRFHPEHA